MHRLAALCCLLIATPAVFALTADELAEKNITAKGGRESLAAVQSVRLTGKMRVNGGAIELGLVTLVKRPDAIRLEAELQGLTQVQAFDGKQAWQINPFQGRKDPEKLSADDAKGLAEDAQDFLGALVDYQSKGYKLDYLGTEDIDGTDAHKLRVSRPNGDVSYLYLDPDQFLEIRIVNRRIEHGVPNETVIDLGDYEKVAGVYLPFYQEAGQKGAREREQVQFERAEVNVQPADALFQVPAAVARAAN